MKNVISGFIITIFIICTSVCAFSVFKQQNDFLEKYSFCLLNEMPFSEDLSDLDYEEILSYLNM